MALIWISSIIQCGLIGKTLMIWTSQNLWFPDGWKTFLKTEANVFVLFKFSQPQNQNQRNKGQGENIQAHTSTIQSAMLLQMVVCEQNVSGKSWKKASITWWSAWTPASPPLPLQSICSPWYHDQPAAWQKGEVKDRKMVTEIKSMGGRG